MCGPGVLRIFSKATIDYLTQKVMQDGHNEKCATLAYVWAGYKLRNAWLAEMEPGWRPVAAASDAAAADAVAVVATPEPTLSQPCAGSCVCVQKDPSGVLDATARAAAEHAHTAAQHAVDIADCDAHTAFGSAPARRQLGWAQR